MKQIKVKLSQSMPWRHTAEADIQLHLFFNSALDGGELQTSYPNHFTPGKGPRIPIKYEAQWGGLDNLEKRKMSCLRRDSNSGSSSPQSGHYTNYAIPAPQYTIAKQ